jgi:hypothetical protein
VAKPAPYSSSKPPSAWAIVIVAFLLILMPVLFCTGIMMSASRHQESSTAPAPAKK